MKFLDKYLKGLKEVGDLGWLRARLSKLFAQRVYTLQYETAIELVDCHLSFNIQFLDKIF